MLDPDPHQHLRRHTHLTPPGYAPEAFARRPDENSKKPDKPEEKPDKEDKDQPKPWSPLKKIVVFSILAAVVLIGGLIALFWWLHARDFEKTDDAFIDAHSQRVAPQAAGRVARILVDDNQLVSAGQLLLEIDPADYQATLDQSLASIEQARSQQSQAAAQKEVAQANVEQTNADILQAQTTLDNATQQLRRYERLTPEAQSAQHLDDLRAAVRNDQAQLTATQKRLEAARSQVDLAESQIKAADASLSAAMARTQQARLNLGYTHVVATIAGRVTNRSVQVGDYLTVGQQLLTLVPRDVYITANYKETQLTLIRPNQPVDIEVDAYPDQTLHGHVDSIQKGSGAFFSLLPPENATGNYVKVVQRVPVKIVFDDTDTDVYRKLSPGMSVTPKVRVR